MYIRPCEHPLRLKVQGKWQYVACGKCPTCQNRKASRIVERLTQESQCHPYTCFFTLTYDEKHVPKLFLNPNEEVGSWSLYDPQREVFVDTSEIKGFNPSSRLYIQKRKEIPYAYMKDVQDFFKRLRYYIESILKYEKCNKKIRYYVVSEYGPTTLRPHYHGLIWFDSRSIAMRVHEFVAKAWTLGRTDVQFAFGKSEQYVARYVSCVSGLPKIYLHRELRPRSLSSTSPAIGTLSANQEEVRQIFENGSVERVLQVQSSHKAKVSPLWRTFENRLFPKLSGFDAFTHYERITLYSLYSNPDYDDFCGFVGWVKKNHVKCELKGVQTWLDSYLWSLYQEDCDSLYLEKWYRLKKLYYTSARVYHQRQIFGVSLDYYINRIENYWSNRSLYQLRNFYEFQEDYSRKTGSALALVHLYIYSCKWNKESKEYEHYIPEYYLETFGFDCSTPLSISASFDAARKGEALNTREFVCLNHKIWFDSIKSKKRNDYLAWCQEKEKFNFNLSKKYE